MDGAAYSDLHTDTFLEDDPRSVGDFCSMASCRIFFK
jgi:hypothetical protein